MKKSVLLNLLLLFITTAAEACPMCSSPRAVQVRNYLFGPDLPFNLFALLLPFLIFAAIGTALYYYDVPFTSKKRI